MSQTRQGLAWGDMRPPASPPPLPPRGPHGPHHQQLKKSNSLQSSFRSVPESHTDVHNLSNDSGISPSPAMFSQSGPSPVTQFGPMSQYHRIPQFHPRRQLRQQENPENFWLRHDHHHQLQRSSAPDQSDLYRLRRLSADGPVHVKRSSRKKQSLDQSFVSPPPLPPRGFNVFQPTLQVRSFGQDRAPSPPVSPAITLPPDSPFSAMDSGLYVLENSEAPFSSTPSWKERKNLIKARAEEKRSSFCLSSSDDEHFGIKSRDLVQPKLAHRLSLPNQQSLQVRYARPASVVPCTPPPPPPRDPSRRLSVNLNEHSRPVSYTFEDVPAHGEDPDDLGIPILDRVPAQPPSPFYNGLSYESHQLHSPGESLSRPLRTRHGSQPALLIPPHRIERARLAISDHSRDCSPQRPLRKKLSNASSTSGNKHTSRDSVISMSQHIQSSGKSSPTSSSISSKDSGCQDTGGRIPRPLSAVDEIKEAEHSQHDMTPPPPRKLSPVRSKSSDPGFSTKERRARFRDALNDLEDVLDSIQKDADLLDRAERRDLPTVHQELIAQARERFQPGPSEENSRHDDSSADFFSDLDNFMNWNTSSSFENIPNASTPTPRPPSSRQRTPSRRRSGVADKTTDDMAYRLKAANNKLPPQRLNQINHSYLKDDKAFSFTQNDNDAMLKDEDEPDINIDDISFRHFRDANANNIQDPQPKFGIPKGHITGASQQDYLHATPDGKYRSTFNSMRNPDLVLDDLAFRALRKDGNLTQPEALGIVKDPNHSHIVPNTCWHHKRETREKDEAEKGPYVFYPRKNNELLQALSKNIAQIIRKQAGSPSGGEDQDVVTYQDLKDPQVKEAMKISLGIFEKDDKAPDKADKEEEDEEWQGKNLFQLLTSNMADLIQKQKEKKMVKENASPIPHDDSVTEKNDSVQTDVIVQHCVLEYDSPLPMHPHRHNNNVEDFELPKTSMKASVMTVTSLENQRDSEKEKERSRSCCEESDVPEEVTKVVPVQVQEQVDEEAKADDCQDGSSNPDRRLRSRSIRRETRRRRELSAGRRNSAEAMPLGGAKYKEERRRQLASQIANRYSSVNSSSDEDEPHESYSRFRRRKKKEQVAIKSGSDSPEHIYQTIGSEIYSEIVDTPPIPTPRRSKISQAGRQNRTSASSLSSFVLERDAEPAKVHPVRGSVSPGLSSDSRATTKSSSNNDPAYCSEEILMQAASDLQGIGDFSGQKSNSSRLSQLASPTMIKNVEEPLSPPAKAAESSSALGKTSLLRSSTSEEEQHRYHRGTTPTSIASTDEAVLRSKPPISSSPSSPGTPGGSNGKPPVFPEHRVQSSKAGLRKVDPTFLGATRREAASTASGPPAFVKEFAGVVRRRSGGGFAFNPNEPAPPRAQTSQQGRPQSAVYPSPTKSNGANRRKSDFLAKYEDLTERATFALRLASEFVPDMDRVESPEPEEVEFNEEEVLKTCQDFIKDYDNSRRRQSTDFTSTSPMPVVRTRSSSLTYLDKRSPPPSLASQGINQQDQRLKPILKKSSEDLSNLKPVPILKHKDSESNLLLSGVLDSSIVGGILKKRSSEDNQSRPDHIRIRSPSPDSGSFPSSRWRSRNSSNCESRASSPEIQSILKRRSSTEDCENDTRSSPEPQGILKRKYSSAGTSCSHSPESLDGLSFKAISSILKKQSSLEEVESNDEPIKSILKKSTDDELDQESPASDRPPRSILKSRKSEDSLSPLSDPSEVVVTSVVPLRAPTVVEDPGQGDLKPRPILKRKDSRDELGARGRTLSPPGVDENGNGSNGKAESVISFVDEVSASLDVPRQELEKELAAPLPCTKPDVSFVEPLPIVNPHSVTVQEERYGTADAAKESSPGVNLISQVDIFIPGERSEPSKTEHATADTSFNDSISNDPSKLPLLDRVRLFETSNLRRSPPLSPRKPGSGLGRRRRQLELAARFLTQPITIDEVQEASRNLFKVTTRSGSQEHLRSVRDSPKLGLDVNAKIKGFMKKQESHPQLGEDQQPLPQVPPPQLANRRSSSFISRSERSKRSILKHESFDADSNGRLRGVLKKDSSYDETLRPILKNPEVEAVISKPPSPSSSSNEDVSSALKTHFNDVVIDPIPGVKKPIVEQVQFQSQRRSSFKNREPVIPPSSVNISSDDRDLAEKLDKISQEAEAIKLQQLQQQQEEEEESLQQPRSTLTSQNTKKVSTASSSSSRKTSNDVGAEEYYRIFKAQCKAPVNTFNYDPSTVTAGNKRDEEEEEEKERNNNDEMETKMSTGIAARLEELKKNGEENWKRKVTKPDANVMDNKRISQALDMANSNMNKDDDNNQVIMRKGSKGLETPKRPVSLLDRMSKLENAQQSWKNRVGDKDMPIITENLKKDLDEDEAGDEVVQLRNKKISKPPTSIIDRLSKLEESSQTWSKRVEEKDASKFTVAGKMEMEQQRKAIADVVTKLSPEKVGLLHSVSVHSTPKPRTITGEAVKAKPSSPEVPDLGEDRVLVSAPLDTKKDMDKFFSSFSRTSMEEEAKVVEDDFDFDLIESHKRLSVQKRVSRPKGRRTSKNPVKHLSVRTDLIEEYIEVVKPAQDEFQDMKRDKNHSRFASEALAGLASKEDFSNVQLRKGANVDRTPELIPYKRLMLLQVKGRRVCQTRLVEPKASSINSGDAYVLVTPKEVFNWLGKFANVIERSRSAEIAQTVFQRKDLGCKQARSVTTIDEEKTHFVSRAVRDFWKHLGVDEPCPRPAGPAEEDEIYEAKINELNLIWEVSLDNGVEELVPMNDAWGCVPKHCTLDTSKVLVIDFGPETYVWNGKNASFELRRAGINLAKKVFEQGFDYDGPLLGSNWTSETRPDWSLLGKVTQHMETVLFKEKFADWPEETKVIRVREEEEKMQVALWTCSGEIDCEPFDADEMLSWQVEDPNLELEMSYLGRGRGYYDVAERRQYEIDTVSLKSYFIDEYEIKPLDENWHAQFHSEEAYVFRWIYKVSLTGRDLKGNKSKHAAVGRERCAYFFWQGSDSKVTEKGTSALMTVELDKEKGPQLKVEQGKEEAAFLNLFDGCMTVHKGKRGANPKRGPRLFIVRGEAVEEAMVVEVECRASSLRSLASFILLPASSSCAILWHGKSSPDHAKAIARSYLRKMTTFQPVELGSNCRSFTEETEGEESPEFQEAVKMRAGSGSNSYFANYPLPLQSPRLFHMTAVSGQFQVIEVLCPFRNVKVINPMGFNQSDLYIEEQPSLFLLDTGAKLWLWQGWWPSGGEGSDNNTTTGSGMIRWHAERRAAMQTTVDYRRQKYKDTKKPETELVWAGWEPLEFTNLFPTWKDRVDVRDLNEEYVKDSSLEKTLMALSKREYSWEELQQRPLPDGVDPAKLEKYLSDSDFEKYLGLSRDSFMTLQKWKQLEIRKEKGLF